MKGKRTINKSLDLLQRMRVPRLGQNIVWRLLGTGVYRRMEPSEFYKGGRAHTCTHTNRVQNAQGQHNKLSGEVAPAKKQKQKNNMMLRGTVVVTKELLRGRRW